MASVLGGKLASVLPSKRALRSTISHSTCPRHLSPPVPLSSCVVL